ncbi:MAG: carboxy-S-adenosyl-L-methionine synthase CmoA [Planctomycetes bacterium]|nr:carboxy-S-adenosyl-L-methionine synthase CmoA [Planctomycetota bacterium]
MSNNKSDRIFSEYRERISDFVFDEQVVSVFDDMIQRSVPGYATVIAMTKVIAEQYASAGSNCYDLGCSLGASTLAMRHGIAADNCRITAVDNSAAMVEKCRKIVEADSCDVPVDIIQSDILDMKIENASVAVMNFVLQFLAPTRRDEMIQKIYDGTNDGGVLVLSEKIAYEDSDEDDFQISMHHNFKKLHGYSDMEVSQKRKSLENVLIPDTLKTHQKRLSEAGFKKSYVWFKCFNFVSLAAFK